MEVGDVETRGCDGADGGDGWCEMTGVTGRDVEAEDTDGSKRDDDDDNDDDDDDDVVNGGELCPSPFAGVS
jgi:hypothetical protein